MVDSTSCEVTPLLPTAMAKNIPKRHRQCCRIACCIQSKAARLILLWNFSVLLVYKMFYDINGVIQVGNSNFVLVLLTLSFTLSAAFSPMAGLLTDIKFSRYKVVGCTSYAIIVILFIAMGLIISIKTIWYFIDSFALRIGGYSVFTFLIVVYMVFIINAFHFGMDQLHDSSTEDSILYIHWYVWIYYTCTFIAEISWNLIMHDSYYYYDVLDRLRITGISIVGLVFIIALLFLITSLCVVRYRKVWFLFEPAGVNPYKLVYRVVRFAYQHKVPLRRSAFTYCDEESQTRLDVGKHKYGGPFTTKQVEDVKAFWGILKVLVSIGPAFLLQTVTQTMLPMFTKHNKIFLHINNSNGTTFHQEVHPEGLTRHILISNGLLSPLLITICIPLYLCWIRPRIQYYIPGMLNRIHLAIAVMTLSLLSFLAMDIVVHLMDNEDANCMFRSYAERNIMIAVEIMVNVFPSSPLYQNVYFFTTQHVLSALADMLFDIAVLEFICSQSPYSMKGLLLGIFFSLRNLFQGIAIVLILPFGMVWKIESLSCGSGFYAMNIVISLLEFVLFSCVSKRYKYKEVNEPSNEYRYAEEYYSNIQ